MEAGDVQTETPPFYEQLRDTLAEPDPMCLAVVRAKLDGASWKLDPHIDFPSGRQKDVLDAIGRRLVQSLRPYDLLAQIDDKSFVVILKTMAPADTLRNRMFELYGDLVSSYQLVEGVVEVPVSLGAAVRMPSELPSQLLRRAEGSLQSAIAAGGKAPVLT